MKESKVKLSNYQVDRLFKEFNSQVFKPGIDTTYSYFVYKNGEYLSEPYLKLMNELFDEQRHPDFQNMKIEENALIMKYADRDEQANIIKDQNGLPIITENIIEYTKAHDELENKYNDLYNKINNKAQINHEIYSKENEYNLLTLSLAEFPATTPPFVIGLLNSQY